MEIEVVFVVDVKNKVEFFHIENDRPPTSAMIE